MNFSGQALALRPADERTAGKSPEKSRPRNLRKLSLKIMIKTQQKH